jgi:molybdate-binding protein
MTIISSDHSALVGNKIGGNASVWVRGPGRNAADTGLGIHAAAQALSLDFIPVTKERYDLVIPRVYLQDEKIQILLAMIRSDEFKQKALAMGGYEVHETGNLVQQA